MTGETEFDLGPGLRLEAQIAESEGQGIRGRWEFGRWLLGQRVGKQLPKGLLDQVVAATGTSRQELGYRMRFAERYSTDEQVANAVGNFGSWHGVVNDALGTAHVSNNAGESEWYTPADYIAAAAAVMGAIDLDPASTAEANAVVGAKRIYTAADDGLAQEWTGRVWMNPPYAQPLIGAFCAKLAASEGVTEAITLSNNATETAWLQDLAASATAACFPRGRIKFWHPERDSAAPLQGQALLYLGPNAKAFRREFGRFGFVAAL